MFNRLHSPRGVVLRWMLMLLAALVWLGCQAPVDEADGAAKREVADKGESDECRKLQTLLQALEQQEKTPCDLPCGDPRRDRTQGNYRGCNLLGRKPKCLDFTGQDLSYIILGPPLQMERTENGNLVVQHSISNGEPLWVPSTAQELPADVDGTDFTGAKFDHASLNKVDFRRTKILPLVRMTRVGGNIVTAETTLMSFKRAQLAFANLSGANLRVANLSDADRSGADQRVANLSDADLSGAYLLGTNLSCTDLTKADLQGADLSDADLSGAELGDAILIGASLNRSNLRAAKLFGADLTNAKLFGADLTLADLRGANLSGSSGLETATLTSYFGTPKRWPEGFDSPSPSP